MEWSLHSEVASCDVSPRWICSPHSVSSCGATGTRCSITTLAGTCNVHVSSVSIAEQGHSETLSHSDLGDHTDHPPGGRLCHNFSDGKSCHLHAWNFSCSTSKQQDFQKRSLGLPQHLEDPQQITYKRTELGCRTRNWSPSSNSHSSSLFPVIPLWDPRPLHSKDQGYRSCLALVLSCSGKAEVVQDRIILDIISYMQLERPRHTQSYQSGIWALFWRP